MIAVEGKRIKKVEGVPMRKEDQNRSTDEEAHNVPLESVSARAKT
jgi:hypothetical protein